ncbi:hypothetical protein VPH35_026662 [Triticum aestivum]
MASSWSELPHELLGLLIARLPFPNDRARFRAVCRSWRSALRHHGHHARQLIVLPEGSFMTPSDGRSYPLPSFPDNATCIGSTDDWIALRQDDIDGRHRFLLHNPFSKASVPLTLDTIIGKATTVQKVLVRSISDGDLVVAIMTNNIKHPLILSHGGKNICSFTDSWVYNFVVDIAFLEHKLYAITPDENLLTIHVGEVTASDDNRVIQGQPDFFIYNAQSASENEEDFAGTSDEKAAWTSDEDVHEDDGHDYYCDGPNDDSGDDYCYDDADVEEPCEKDVNIVRYLVESCGKLLMVRQHVQLIAPPGLSTHLTCRAEVFEMGANAWVPMTNGLGGGQALFVSMCFSKSVSAPHGEVEEDSIYFVNTGEVFNIRSNTCRPLRRDILISSGTWVFPPKLVV